jgi:hypothetical protein
MQIAPLITPFRVRLATEDGFRQGLIGTVIGEHITPSDKGPKLVFKVLWFNVNEETGEESTSDQPAPCFHEPRELRAAVVDDFEDDEDEDEGLTDEAPESRSTRPPEATI